MGQPERIDRHETDGTGHGSDAAVRIGTDAVSRITLAADLYTPKGANGKLPAIAVCGPFGAVKEQASGLYAQEMAGRGFAVLPLDPSYTGESGGAPRYGAFPDINTEDFSAAVGFLSVQNFIDPERIGIIGICGWGRLALNAQRTVDYKNGGYALGGVADPLPEDAPFFVKSYYDYYKTRRG